MVRRLGALHARFSVPRAGRAARPALEAIGRYGPARTLTGILLL